MKCYSRIKGVRREARRRKRQYGHRVSGRSVFLQQQLAGRRARAIEAQRKKSSGRKHQDA
jgi:hypothetical protein